jgi:hypothetical protein
MPAIELLVSTGDPVVDDVLRGVVGLYELVFPGRVRGYYLKGSYASGTAVATSDIDVEILFKGSLDGAELDKAEGLIASCRLLSSVGLDLGPTGEDAFLQPGAPDRTPPTLKLGSRLLYGEDIRDRIALPPVRVWVQSLMYGQPSFMARIRGGTPVLRYPLGYPDAHGDFLGYDRAAVKCRDGVSRPSTKDLVRIVTGAASAIAAWRGGRYVVSKSQSVAAYRDVIGGEWAGFVEEIDARCRAEWTYLVPEQPAARQRLRALCERALAFENHFLECLRDFLLEELAPPETPDTDDAWLPAAAALRTLARIRYLEDRAVERALAVLAATCPDALREAAQTAL